MKPATHILLAAASAARVAAQTSTGTTSSSTSTTDTSSTTFSAATSTATCVSGVHVIVARGSGEDPGLGRAGVVAGNVTAKIDGSTVEAVDYPATIEDYFVSEHDGAVAMGALLESYLGRCPDSKVVLVGYSQGAQAASDLVCGTSETLFESTSDLGSQYESNIVAVALFGNPAHLGNSSWNAGTSTQDGIFPRKNPSGCEPYIPKMRSWCDKGDVYCDAGNDTTVHGSYFTKYTQNATDWVVSMYQDALSSSSSSSGTATGTAATNTGSSTTSTGNIASETGKSAGFRLMPTWSVGLAALGTVTLMVAV